MAAPPDVVEAEEVLAAADIICSLRDADLSGWTPPWCKPAPSPQEGELIWPTVVRGKRSRRRSPSEGTASGKGRWGLGSPASPLDYSGGSGASTSGGEDGGFCSTGLHRPAPATKVESTREPQLTFPTPLPRPSSSQRPRKKLKLPEVKQLVRSLEVENVSLREEMRALQRACAALSKENDRLEIKLQRPNASWKEVKGKQQVDPQLAVQSPRDCFMLPDLNLPPQDAPADLSPVH